MGLVWANQVNVRLLLTKTVHMDHIAGADQILTKDGEDCVVLSGEDAIRIRNLSVVFSCVGPPTSVPYIITEGGVSTIDNV